MTRPHGHYGPRPCFDPYAATECAASPDGDLAAGSAPRAARRGGRSLSRRLLRGVVGLAALWSVGANAMLVTVTGRCVDSGNVLCADIGLASQAPVAASFNVDGDGSLANLNLTKADVNDFAMDFGTVAFTMAELPNNWDFTLVTNGAGAITAFQFLASFGTSAANRDLSVDLRLNGWAASTAGVCYNSTNSAASACDFSVPSRAFGFYGGTAGYGTVDHIQINAVPTAPTWALVPLAFAGLGFARRRRSQG